MLQGQAHSAERGAWASTCLLNSAGALSLEGLVELAS